MRCWPWLILLTAVVLLAGCPTTKQADTGAPATTGAPAQTEGGQTDSGATTSTPDSGTTPPAATDPAPAGPEGSAPDGQAGGTSQKLEGEWFAMFGRHDIGLVEHAWLDGHKVVFQKDGIAIWTELTAGKSGRSLTSRWSTRGGDLALGFSAVDAAKSGLSRLAPLGIGRNEEIGLLSAHRPTDAEIRGAKVVTERLKFTLEGEFLTLSDSIGRLMVYGRSGMGHDSPPDCAGKAYTGHIGKQADLAAKVGWDGADAEHAAAQR